MAGVYVHTDWSGVTARLDVTLTLRGIFGA
jgi:hypothetical protein